VRIGLADEIPNDERDILPVPVEVEQEVEDEDEETEEEEKEEREGEDADKDGEVGTEGGSPALSVEELAFAEEEQGLVVVEAEERREDEEMREGNKLMPHTNTVPSFIAETSLSPSR
tara:strand:- start:200 stop:550 length:351 start_codon:yes stop_codon:yes gene_type:complete